MTSEHIIFVLGCSLMSLGVSYAWWLKVRVIWLRQDIYDLRDELFMESVRLDRVDDAGARAAREHLNTLARISPIISIPLIANAIQLGVSRECPVPKSSHSDLNTAITTAMEQADRRLARYLLKHTLSGLVIFPTTRFFSMTWVEDKFVAWVRLWRASTAAEDAVRVLDRAGVAIT